MSRDAQREWRRRDRVRSIQPNSRSTGERVSVGQAHHHVYHHQSIRNSDRTDGQQGGEETRHRDICEQGSGHRSREAAASQSNETFDGKSKRECSEKRGVHVPQGQAPHTSHGRSAPGDRGLDDQVGSCDLPRLCRRARGAQPTGNQLPKGCHRTCLSVEDEAPEPSTSTLVEARSRAGTRTLPWKRLQAVLRQIQAPVKRILRFTDATKPSSPIAAVFADGWMSVKRHACKRSASGHAPACHLRERTPNRLAQFLHPLRQTGGPEDDGHTRPHGVGRHQERDDVK